MDCNKVVVGQHAVLVLPGLALHTQQMQTYGPCHAMISTRAYCCWCEERGLFQESSWCRLERVRAARWATPDWMTKQRTFNKKRHLLFFPSVQAWVVKIKPFTEHSLIHTNPIFQTLLLFQQTEHIPGMWFLQIVDVKALRTKQYKRRKLRKKIPPFWPYASIETIKVTTAQICHNGKLCADPTQ